MQSISLCKALHNFFRYIRQEYALDKIIQYSIDEIDKNIKVVNPEYNNISYRMKKKMEKLSQRNAKLYELEQENVLQLPEKESLKWIKTKLEWIENAKLVKQHIQCLLDNRKGIPYNILISQMPESIRYNRLNKESKTLQNVIKMICYRAETALACRFRRYPPTHFGDTRSLLLYHTI